LTISQKIEENSKIHLLHLVEGLGMGGAEVLLIQYIKSLGMRDYKHFVYGFGRGGPMKEKIEALGVNVYMGKRRAHIKQPIRFITHLLSLLRDLMTFIKSNRIQLIQSHLSHANKLAVLVGKLAGVPAFPTIHNTMEFVDRRSRWDFRVYINKAVDWFIFPMADQILAVSQEIKEIVHQKFRVKNSKIMVLKNGIVFDDSLSIPVNLEKEFSISNNTLKILAVGRLSYQKAMEVIVKAAAELVKHGLRNLLVMIVGEGEERIRLKNLIRDLDVENNVKLLGIRHDVIELMRASDMFLMPSRYEGLSIAMIEAMACGLPIIASDAPGLKTYITHGENGLLFPIEDHKAMAKCILQLSEDGNIRETLSLGARESFEKEYNMRKNIKSLDMFFRKYAKIKNSPLVKQHSRLVN
jgi:glycosyltransferase involved in cell wall biosynthesis